MFEINDDKVSLKVFGETVELCKILRPQSKHFRKEFSKAEGDIELIMDAYVNCLVGCGLKKSLSDRMTDEQIVEVFKLVMPQEKKS